MEGKKCLVIEKRSVPGGNIACEDIDGIAVHKYGPHIFHTSDEKVWKFVNGIVPLKPFTLQTMANYRGKIYNLPFNMNTFYELWGVKTPEEARRRIESQRVKPEGNDGEAANLEEQALSLAGRDVYETLIKGYTEKQWGRKCRDLPAFIIKRLPFRFNYDNNYFNDTWQGIPCGGYNALTTGLLDGIEVKCDTDFFADRKGFKNIADRVVFTGKIDEYFDYQYGKLQYRTMSWDTERLPVENYQGCPVMNYTGSEVPYTRVIEHKWFARDCKTDFTVVSKEYPREWADGSEPMYPVNDAANNALYAKYKNLAAGRRNVIFGGRLAEYKYYDMDKVVKSAMERWDGRR
jgi:UDP-galactopyranose mutase